MLAWASMPQVRSANIARRSGLPHSQRAFDWYPSGSQKAVEVLLGSAPSQGRIDPSLDHKRQTQREPRYGTELLLHTELVHARTV